MEKAISYLRVSTDSQGITGYGIDAQREAINNYLESNPHFELIEEFVEVASGKDSNRKEMEEAIRLCKLSDATLLVSKYDRLTRDLHFLTSLQKSQVKFISTEMPDANSTMIQIMVSFAEFERNRISQRTREGLAAAKKKGKVLGNPRLKAGTRETAATARAADEKKARDRAMDLLPIVEELKANGAKTYQDIADGLNLKRIVTVRGKSWSVSSIQNLMIQYQNMSVNVTKCKSDEFETDQVSK